jgi:hypothetical protein
MSSKCGRGGANTDDEEVPIRRISVVTVLVVLFLLSISHGLSVHHYSRRVLRTDTTSTESSFSTVVVQVYGTLRSTIRHRRIRGTRSGTSGRYLKPYMEY